MRGRARDAAWPLRDDRGRRNGEEDERRQLESCVPRHPADEECDEEPGRPARGEKGQHGAPAGERAPCERDARRPNEDEERGRRRRRVLVVEWLRLRPGEGDSPRDGGLVLADAEPLVEPEGCAEDRPLEGEDAQVAELQGRGAHNLRNGQRGRLTGAEGEERGRADDFVDGADGGAEETRVARPEADVRDDDEGDSRPEPGGPHPPLRPPSEGNRQGSASRRSEQGDGEEVLGPFRREAEADGGAAER